MYLARTGTGNDLMPKYRYIILEDNVVSVPLKFFVNKPIETSVTKHRTLVIKKRNTFNKFLRNNLSIHLSLEQDMRFIKNECEFVLSSCICNFKIFRYRKQFDSIFVFCRVGPMLALFLIAVGTGGIKPCVSSFGGDQFTAEQVSKLKGLFTLITRIASINGRKWLEISL